MPYPLNEDHCHYLDYKLNVDLGKSSIFGPRYLC